jgi:hypothetical protein
MALGKVGHWGHVHVRKNLYDALVTIEGIDGHWKITQLEVLEERRIEPGAELPSTKETVTKESSEAAPRVRRPSTTRGAGEKK